MRSVILTITMLTTYYILYWNLAKLFFLIQNLFDDLNLEDKHHFNNQDRGFVHVLNCRTKNCPDRNFWSRPAPFDLPWSISRCSRTELGWNELPHWSNPCAVWFQSKSTTRRTVLGRLPGHVVASHKNEPGLQLDIVPSLHHEWDNYNFLNFESQIYSRL